MDTKKEIVKKMWADFHKISAHADKLEEMADKLISELNIVTRKDLQAIELDLPKIEGLNIAIRRVLRKNKK